MREVFKEPQSQGSSSKLRGDNCSICQNYLSKWPLGKPEQKKKLKLFHSLTFFLSHLKVPYLLEYLWKQVVGKLYA